MAKVIIFGIKDFAELAHFYLKNDSTHEVVAFSVNREFLPEDKKFRGLPVVAFEDVDNIFPPEEFMFFAPMSPKHMNADRQAVYEAIKKKAYQCISYVSTKLTMFDNPIGENCFILEDNTIQPFTTIGNNVVLWSGNHIGHHGVIADHVTVTSHVVISGHCKIDSFSFFGVNSTIRDGIHIAQGSFIAMASAITADTEEWSVYKGNPAVKQNIPSTRIKF
ncbi:sugar O-acyltransferase (sialic acid O-acetyltransferase NeuD family) [Undibacterium sp. GrIS 1.8]|uniref:acetyltransferase n=1 Tax=unclassified Undibacterium TaxID=2630295 RepID=UPI00339553D2